MAKANGSTGSGVNSTGTMEKSQHEKSQFCGGSTDTPVNLIDRFDDNFRSVSSIIDSAAVLGAVQDDGGVYQPKDDTLTNMLWHAGQLLDAMKRDTQELFEMASNKAMP